MQSTGRSLLTLTGATLESCVLFEERDGIYWLRGADVQRAHAVLGLACDGTALGFDPEIAAIYANQFLKRHFKVAVQRGTTVRFLTLRRLSKQGAIPFTPLFLAPTLLLDERDLKTLRSRLPSKHSPLRSAVERIARILSEDDKSALNDLGRLYVFKVWDDMYEVDWGLTTLSRVTFEAVALLAHERRETLACRLVAPKGQRERHSAAKRAEPRVTRSEPVTYGQLRLPL